MVKPKLPKIPWNYVKYFIVIAAGLASFYFSMHYMRAWVSTHQDMVSIPVPARNISPGETIGAGDIVGKQFVRLAVDPVTVANSSDVVGKVAVTDLFPGEQIREDKLINQSDTLKPGEAFVSVKTDKFEAVLSGRLKSNMLVDVLCADEKVAPPSPPVILAENALVMAVTNENVENAEGQKAGTRYVLLKVKKQESYNFTKPLTGGQIYFVQIGYLSSEGEIAEVTEQQEVGPVPGQ